MIIILVFIHLLLGHENLHTSLTLIPKSISLFELIVVEVNLTNEEQPQGSKIEILSVDGLYLLNFESVGYLTFLFDHFAQLLEERHCGCQQFGNRLRRAFSASVDLTCRTKNYQISINENLHFDFSEQEGYFLEDFQLSLSILFFFLGVFPFRVAKVDGFFNLNDEVAV